MNLTDGRVGKNRARFAHRTKIPRDLPTGHLSRSRSGPCYQDPSAPAIVADRRSARRRFSAPCGPHLLPDSGYFPGAPLLVLPGCCRQHSLGFTPAAASGSLAASFAFPGFPGRLPVAGPPPFVRSLPRPKPWNTPHLQLRPPIGLRFSPHSRRPFSGKDSQSGLASGLALRPTLTPARLRVFPASLASVPFGADTTGLRLERFRTSHARVLGNLLFGQKCARRNSWISPIFLCRFPIYCGNLWKRKAHILLGCVFRTFLGADTMFHWFA